MDPVRIIVTVASGLAIVLYFAGIACLGVPGWQGSINPEASKYISGAVTVIGGTLGTFFGAVIGLNRVNTTFRKAKIDGVPGEVTKLSGLQIAAAWAYFGSLVLALGLWVWNGFSATTADAVRNLALTLPGVIAGILAVALNVQQP